ncbi:FAD-binding oxidoreductase [Phenylobacterium sp.]|uniref:FAD-binding oxidoreductase n=1 Tax=Phenylobacterium sp. TaxID=1871053 RepID=UPI002C6AA366|nr:FAD-binding oxidoreductase [Phenylobacterium sp.]HLZ75783.1 FAD-binding oxidoreductase [Phenylobacterium sp.]
MLRRHLLKSAAALPLAAGFAGPLTAFAAAPARKRVRPGDPGWPSATQWAALKTAVGGRLSKVSSPLTACAKAPDPAACEALFKSLKNPFFIGDEAGLTQTLGWTDAWTSKPSEYAVSPESAADVAAAVTFARRHNLRLVVKGGGHSYLGGSNAPDSLLIWTKKLKAIELHDAFVPQGCQGKVAPEHAVSVGAGCLWLEAYDAVTTKGGRYVQGGGCTTVGVAGLVQGGGFGSFSKGFGTGAANLLEAEVVTADGVVRIANGCTNPDLFWALKGGGGGAFGVVTRLTLRTHDLPATFGAVNATITAKSDEAFKTLIEKLLTFYRTSLLNPHWGEQIRFQFRRQVSVSMVFQGLSQAEAQAVWKPFFDEVAARPDDYAFPKPQVLAIPARMFWNPDIIGAIPGVIRKDDRPGAPASHFHWDGDGDQVGQVIHAYQSAWLPKDLLQPGRQGALVDALIHAAATGGVSLHCNKGLAGAPDLALARTRDTAMNPAVLDAFALAITGAGEGPAYPGIAGHEPNDARGRLDAKRVAAGMAPLLALPGKPASYLSETDYFEPDWQAAFWGEHYPRLKQVKRRYDPDGLFFVHHSVGCEGWSEDGFTRKA